MSRLIDPVFRELETVSESKASDLLGKGWISNIDVGRLFVERAAQLPIAKERRMVFDSDGLEHIGNCQTAFLYALTDHCEAREVIERPLRDDEALKV